MRETGRNDVGDKNENTENKLTKIKANYMFFFQAEDGIRDVERSRGLGDVYKRQVLKRLWTLSKFFARAGLANASGITWFNASTSFLE